MEQGQGGVPSYTYIDVLLMLTMHLKTEWLLMLTMHLKTEWLKPETCTTNADYAFKK